MRRVKNRGGREILINPNLITIVEPLPGEEGMVALHFGQDAQKAIVRGTLDDYAPPVGHGWAEAAHKLEASLPPAEHKQLGIAAD